MLIFNVTGFLTDFTEGRNKIVVEKTAGQVGDALSELWQVCPGLRDRVVNERGELRPHVNIFVNDQNVRRLEMLATSVPEKSEITILPSVSGG